MMSYKNMKLSFMQGSKNIVKRTDNNRETQVIFIFICINNFSMFLNNLKNVSWFWSDYLVG